MDEPFIGDIRPVAIPFAPKGYAFCAGQLLPINQNQALFSLLGTTFGGDGRTTFALPDLRSRIPIGSGQLTGGGSYSQGQQGGVEGVTLLANQIPSHTHQVTGTLQSSDTPDFGDPANNLPALEGRSQFSSGAANAPMAAAATGTSGSAGGSQAHDNRMPYMGINYVIALTGIYPSRQ
jgi:microcystin-dependent protein